MHRSRPGTGHLAIVSVMTDTECRGSSSEKVLPARTAPRVTLTASGVANPFTAASESATTRSTTALEATCGAECD